MSGSKVREAVLARDNSRCQVCGFTGSRKNPLTMHHIIFKCQGGRSTLENLVTWCANCHREFHKTHSVTSTKHKKKRGRR